MFIFVFGRKIICLFFKELRIFPKDDIVHLYPPTSEECELIILKWGN